MASVTFKRTNNIDSVPIVDGQLIFDASDQKIYLDNGNTREVYDGGSGTDLISNVSDATDNNAFNANATVNLFTRKSSIVDTKAEIQSVTQAGVPLGCKGFNEVIGTGDISALGDGSVTGAILANKSAIDTVNQNLTKILNPEYVEVVADGSKKLHSILAELYTLIDLTKVNSNTYMFVDIPNIGKQHFTLEFANGSTLVFEMSYIKKENNQYYAHRDTYIVASDGSQKMYSADTSTTSTTFGESSRTDVTPSGRVFRIYYK
jgi:hypothetical protein